MLPIFLNSFICKATIMHKCNVNNSTHHFYTLLSGIRKDEKLGFLTSEMMYNTEFCVSLYTDFSTSNSIPQSVF